MQVKRYTNRLDKINAAFQSKSYDIHKKKLQQIRMKKLSGKVTVDECEMKLKKFKEAAQKFQSRNNENRLESKSLLTHIHDIMMRKTNSFTTLHRFKSTSSMREKEKIKESNFQLIKKIKEERSNMLSKRDLKKQFAQYEQAKNRIRKIRILQSKKQSHFKNKSLTKQ